MMKSFFTKVIPLACLLACIGFSAPQAVAQNVDCGTDLLHERMLQEFPNLRQLEEASEQQYQEYIKTQSNQRTGSVVTIPVVVHIIQTSTNELVTDAEVQSQLDVLNEDFRKMAGTPGDGAGVDTEYQFCLATIDPNGCPTNGINRIVNPGLAFHEQSDETLLKGLIQWPPTKYLNCWVPRTIETGGSQGGQVIGYATFPTFLPIVPSRDGIVIHSGFFGRNANASYQGRTTTHEVGHWLGLFHTFQGGCQGSTSGSCANAGDRVCDTPQALNPNFGCPSLNSCTADPADQIENYMDYSNGVCQDMFTAGQDARMDFHTTTYRSVIISAQNQTDTGCDGTQSPGCVPQADFVADNLNTCIGEPVTFTDLSIGPATSWEWTFTGGNPATSTASTPTVTYAAAGTYTVELKATNALGNSTEVKSGYITVDEPSQPPLVQGFEGILFLPQGWSTQDEDMAGSWSVSTNASSEGQNSMKIQNYQANNEGTFDNLNSEVFDLSNSVSAELTFDHSYKRFNAFQLDTLKVRVSTDCGSTWNTVWERAGVTLVTVAGFELQNEWVPSQASHWVNDTVSLDSFVGHPNVKIQWQNISGNGQSIYIDKVNMQTVLTSSAEAVENAWSLNVSPNPFYDDLKIGYQLAKASEMRFVLTDISGKVLYRHATGKQAPGAYSVPISQDVYANLPSGIYFLKGESAFGNITRKLVKMD